VKVNQIGRTIYFDKLTGNVLVDKGEMHGAVIKTTVEQDIAIFVVLAERIRDSFDYIALPYGAFAQDFAACNGYRVNVETYELEFSYPDISQPMPQEPEFQKPLSIQIAELKEQLTITQQALDEIILGGAF
jgi:hypothetical protein